MAGEGKQKRKVRDLGRQKDLGTGSWGFQYPKLAASSSPATARIFRSQNWAHESDFETRQIWIQVLCPFLVMRPWARHKLFECQFSYLQTAELLIG